MRRWRRASPASPVVEAALTGLLDTWRLDDRLARRVRTALERSPCERVATLRRLCSLVGVGVDVDRMFTEVLTPAFILAMLADVGATGALSRADIRLVEESVLATVNAEGSWMTLTQWRKRA